MEAKIEDALERLPRGVLMVEAGVDVAVKWNWKGSKGSGSSVPCKPIPRLTGGVRGVLER